MIKVSIIVPIYNTGEYLEKCINSLVNQTLKEIEIILVDDGSTDNSYEIAQKFAENDERIILLRQENSGQSVARNKGLEIARGEYIGFVDSDDWVDLNFYKSLYMYSINNNLDISVSGRNCYSKLYIKEREINVKEEIITLEKNNLELYLSEKLLNDHRLSACNKIYRKRIIKENKIFFEDIKIIGSEDALFNYYLLKNSKRIGACNDTKYNSITRENSTTQIYDEKYMSKIANLLKKMEQSKNQNYNERILFFIHFFFNYIEKIKKLKNNKKEAWKKLFKTLKNELILNKIMKFIVYGRYRKKNLEALGYSLKGRIYLRFIFSLVLLNAEKIVINTLERR